MMMMMSEKGAYSHFEIKFSHFMEEKNTCMMKLGTLALAGMWLMETG
jgi:hypothetical protein